MSNRTKYFFRTNSIEFFLLNPYFIAFVITVCIICVTPNVFEKYEIVRVSNESLNNNKRVVFEDIDNNGKSEKLIFLGRKEPRASYILEDENGAIVDQFNLESKYPNHTNFWFQDANKNGVKEFYIITKSQDSIFLNIHEHFVKNGLWEEKIFIDKISSYKEGYTFLISRGLEGFTDDLKTNDIIFGISAGFGLGPRSIYKYDYKTHTIKKSPHLINTIGLKNVIPLQNGDYKILVRASATSNDLESIDQKRSDYTTWLSLLNSDLSFAFKPIDLKSKGRLNVTYVKKDTKVYPIFIFQSLDKKTPSKLLKLNLKGEILKEYNLPNDKANNLIKINDKSFAVYNRFTGILSFFNSDLVVTTSIELEKNISQLFNYDINNDDVKEWIAFKKNAKRILIYDKNLKNVAEEELPENYLRDYGIKLSNAGDKHFFMVYDNTLSYYQYQNNKYYNLKYLIYIIIYVLVIFTVLLIIKGQQYRDKTKVDLEKKILELQLKTISNQVDSHFVFNAVNTISEMSLSGNKIEIDNFISHYSKFMRITLENSDKISTTIIEELDYVEHFLQLQKIKLKNKFDYKIVIDERIKKSLEIPKNTLFTFVENSVKHGLPKNQLGMIEISLNKIKDEMIITICDNGDGLTDFSKESNGTGNGLEIMDRIFNLFKERFNRDIFYTLQNRLNEEKVIGTIAEIRIKLFDKLNKYG